MVWITSDFNQIAVNTLQEYDLERASVITLVYGPAGVGKTELFRSCFQRLKRKIPVIYIDAQDFVKSYGYAVQNNFELALFRERLRSTSLLILDHLEKLKGKKQSIEEFLHTYDTLSERGAKMIIGFEGAPHDLRFLGDKLYSRLLGGLTIPILPPNESDLILYLNHYARSHYLIIEDEVIKKMANLVINFREAQEIFQGYIRYADRYNEALDEGAFSRFISIREKESIRLATPENIVQKVAELTQVEPSLIFGTKRVPRVHEARQFAIYSIRLLCHLSYPEIGRYFGKAHSSIITSCKQFQVRLQEEPSWAEKFNTLLHYFRANNDLESL